MLHVKMYEKQLKIVIPGNAITQKWFGMLTSKFYSTFLKPVFVSLQISDELAVKERHNQVVSDWYITVTDYLVKKKHFSFHTQCSKNK